MPYQKYFQILDQIVSAYKLGNNLELKLFKELSSQKMCNICFWEFKASIENQRSIPSDCWWYNNDNFSFGPFPYRDFKRVQVNFQPHCEISTSQ